jgi:hypothetical protein
VGGGARRSRAGHPRLCGPDDSAGRRGRSPLLPLARCRAAGARLELGLDAMTSSRGRRVPTWVPTWSAGKALFAGMFESCTAHSETGGDRSLLPRRCAPIRVAGLCGQFPQAVLGLPCTMEHEALDGDRAPPLSARRTGVGRAWGDHPGEPVVTRCQEPFADVVACLQAPEGDRTGRWHATVGQSDDA